MLWLGVLMVGLGTLAYGLGLTSFLTGLLRRLLGRCVCPVCRNPRLKKALRRTPAWFSIHFTEEHQARPSPPSSPPKEKR